ncbi:hypothetical protein [Tissierella praeacuta]|uniref:hypothetical protein n=1 Tax=Tissierella praeacuta TaxID=43131 RepID=UPI0028AFCFDA|nr:hypothetical protein [Tissierella praeacuta]
MSEKIIVYGLLLLAFIIGSIYHFKIRQECIFPVKLTRPRIIISIIIPFIFCFMAYIGGNLWYYYILALVAAVFIISGITGEGIHEKGIYYRGIGAATLLLRLAKWEEIKDIEIDINNNKLQSFKLRTTRIYPNQYYSQRDITEIKEYVEE